MKKEKKEITEFITPKGDYLLLKYEEVSKTAGGVLIPEHLREKQWELEVISIGDKVTTAKPGEFILVEMNAPLLSFTRLGEKWAFVREQWIVSTVDPEYRIAEEKMKAEQEKKDSIEDRAKKSGLKIVN